ncbi:hypothetical protein ACSQ67_014559 [Phaseolus vulgaris]
MEGLTKKTELSVVECRNWDLSSLKLFTVSSLTYFLLQNHFTMFRKMTVNMKYIDPTYMIRAIPSNASDNIYCTLLAHGAVHGTMAGYTGFTVGPVNSKHAYIPIARVTERQKTVKLSDRMWARLLASTNQPGFVASDQ